MDGGKSLDSLVAEDHNYTFDTYKAKLIKYKKLISDSKESRSNGFNFKTDINTFFKTLSVSPKSSNKYGHSELHNQGLLYNKRLMLVDEILPISQIAKIEKSLAENGLVEVSRDYIERLSSVAQLINEKIYKIRKY